MKRLCDSVNTAIGGNLQVILDFFHCLDLAARGSNLAWMGWSFEQPFAWIPPWYGQFPWLHQHPSLQIQSCAEALKVRNVPVWGLGCNIMKTGLETRLSLLGDGVNDFSQRDSQASRALQQRKILIAVSRSMWCSSLERVFNGAMAILSPVWIPSGSKFSMLRHYRGSPLYSTSFQGPRSTLCFWNVPALYISTEQLNGILLRRGDLIFLTPPTDRPNRGDRITIRCSLFCISDITDMKPKLCSSVSAKTKRKGIEATMTQSSI